MALSASRGEITRAERTYLGSLFVLFGIGIMAMVPRLPDLKQALGVDNGRFGVLLSMGSIGSFFALVLMGHVIHRLGVFPVITSAASVMFLSMIAQSHTHSQAIFVFLNITCAFAMSTYHISINAQALQRQTESREVLIPMLHGSWSFGALISSLLAFAITAHVSLSVHITILEIIILTLVLNSIRQLRPTLLPGSTNESEVKPVAVRDIIKTFEIDKTISFGLLMVLMLEFASNDWATLFTKDVIGMSSSASIVPYIAMMVAMILGRFTVKRVLSVKSEHFVFRYGAIMGGLGFLIFFLTARAIVSSQQAVAYILTIFAFFIGGLGSSVIGPMLFTKANERSKLPGGMVVAQIGVINVTLVFLMKLILAWVVARTSITHALVIPGVMLVVSSVVARIAKRD